MSIPASPFLRQSNTGHYTWRLPAALRPAFEKWVGDVLDERTIKLDQINQWGLHFFGARPDALDKARKVLQEVLRLTSDDANLSALEGVKLAACLIDVYLVNPVLFEQEMKLSGYWREGAPEIALKEKPQTTPPGGRQTQPQRGSAVPPPSFDYGNAFVKQQNDIAQLFAAVKELTGLVRQAQQSEEKAPPVSFKVGETVTDGTRKGLVCVPGIGSVARAVIPGSDEVVSLEGWSRRRVMTTDSAATTPRTDADEVDSGYQSEEGEDDEPGLEDDPTRWEAFCTSRQNRRELMALLREKVPKKAGVNRDAAEATLRAIEMVLQPASTVEDILVELNDQFVQWQVRESKGWKAAQAFGDHLRKRELPKRTMAALEAADRASKAAKAAERATKNGRGSAKSTPTSTPRGQRAPQDSLRVNRGGKGAGGSHSSKGKGRKA